MICSVFVLISLFSYATGATSLVRLRSKVELDKEVFRLQPVCGGLLINKTSTFDHHTEVFYGILTAGRCCDVTKSIGRFTDVAEANAHYIHLFPSQLPVEQRWRLLLGIVDFQSEGRVEQKVRVVSNDLEPRVFLSRHAAHSGNLQGVCVIDLSGVDTSAFPSMYYRNLEFFNPNIPLPTVGESLMAARLTLDELDQQRHTTELLKPVIVVAYRICASKFDFATLGVNGATDDHICVEYYKQDGSNAEIVASEPPEWGTFVITTNKKSVGVVTAVVANYEGEKHLLLVIPNRHLHQFVSRIARWSMKH